MNKGFRAFLSYFLACVTALSCTLSAFAEGSREFADTTGVEEYDGNSAHRL